MYFIKKKWFLKRNIKSLKRKWKIETKMFEEEQENIKQEKRKRE